MRFYLLAATVLAGGVGGLATHFLTGTTGLSPAQKREVQEVVQTFMKGSNEAPALVANALQTYAQQQEEVQIKETQGRMDAERERLWIKIQRLLSVTLKRRQSWSFFMIIIVLIVGQLIFNYRRS